MKRRLIIWLAVVAVVGTGVVVAVGLVHKDYDLNTRVTIAATPDKVWQVLNDFPNYAQWNPHLRAVDGQPQPHSSSRLEEIFPDGREVVRQIGMKSMAKNYEFIWEGDLSPAPHMLTAKRKLIMTSSEDGGTILRHEIEFRGWLSGPLSHEVFSRYAESMAAMNAALVQRVEQPE